MGLQSYPLIVRVCLAVLDLCWALATLELRRIFDLLLLLARVKLHGRRVSRAGAKKWNVLVEWRRAVAEAPQAVAIARAEDRASPARLTYAEVDALSDEFAAWLKRTEPGGAGAVALLMGNSCAFLVAWLGVAKAGTSTGLGFMAFQSVQNVVFKEGEAWLDAPPPEEPEAAAEPEPEAAPASA